MTNPAPPRLALSFAAVFAAVGVAALLFFVVLDFEPLPRMGALAAVGVATLIAALLAPLAAAGKVPGVLVAALGLPWLASVVTSWLFWQEAFAALGVVGLAEKLSFLQQSTGEGLWERALGAGLTASVSIGCAVAFAIGRGAPAARLVGAGVALLFGGLALRAAMIAWGLGAQLGLLSAVHHALDDTAESFVPLTETYALAGWALAAAGIALAVVGAVRGKQPALWAWIVVGLAGVVLPQAAEMVTWRSHAALAIQVPRFSITTEGFMPAALEVWHGSAKNFAGVVDSELILAKDGAVHDGGRSVPLILAQSASPKALHELVSKLEGNAGELVLVGRAKEGLDPKVSPRLEAFLNPQPWVRASFTVCSPTSSPSDVFTFDGSPDAGLSRLLQATNGCLSAAAARPAIP